MKFTLQLSGSEKQVEIEAEWPISAAEIYAKANPLPGEGMLVVTSAEGNRMEFPILDGHLVRPDGTPVGAVETFSAEQLLIRKIASYAARNGFAFGTSAVLAALGALCLIVIALYSLLGGRPVSWFSVFFNLGSAAFLSAGAYQLFHASSLANEAEQKGSAAALEQFVACVTKVFRLYVFFVLFSFFMLFIVSILSIPTPVRH